MIKTMVLGTAHGHVFHVAETAAQMDDVELVGVYDDDPSRLKTAGEKLHVKGFAELDEAMAQQPDLVLIGAVPSDRASLATRALKQSAAALLDKPIAVTHDALDGLIAAQRQSGRPAMVFYPYRGYPHLLAAKAAIDAGRIGKLVRIFSAGPHRLNFPGRPEWHFTRAGNGGALVDIGSHHFDIVCWFAGCAPSYICATQTNISHPEKKEFQDFAHAQLVFPGGILGHVEVDWLTPDSMKSFGDSRIWFQGTTGNIESRIGDETHALICDDKAAGEALDLTAFPEPGAWTKKLIADVARGERCAIDQEEIWRTSRTSLYALDSALAGGKPIVEPKY